MMLENALSQFLQKNGDLTKPVLLALSGGPDSLALLYQLLKFQSQNSLSFAIAHVDHGWRENSSMEAQQLALLAKKYNLPFHLRKLTPDFGKGNLELTCRMERLRFFRELCSEFHYQAVLLAHHADDYAETVLKRVLEGSDMSCFSGMHSIACVEGVVIWRPWLQIKKKAIQEWLTQQQLIPFEDLTNNDTKYLRAKLRIEVIPYLSKLFGKEISKNLCQLGDDALALDHYLAFQTKEYLKDIQKGYWGYLLDFSQRCPTSKIEIKYLLRRLCKQENVTFSKQCIENAAEKVVAGTSNHKFVSKGHEMHVDRKRVFLQIKRFEPLPPPIRLKMGTQQYGPWTVHVDSFSHGDSSPSREAQWRQVWKGNVCVVLPEAQYQVQLPDSNAPFPGQNATLSKWWTNAKVPAFLRAHIPVITREGKVHHEFLAARKVFSAKEGPFIQITLTAEGT